MFLLKVNVFNSFITPLHDFIIIKLELEKKEQFHSLERSWKRPRHDVHNLKLDLSLYIYHNLYSKGS